MESGLISHNLFPQQAPEFDSSPLDKGCDFLAETEDDIQVSKPDVYKNKKLINDNIYISGRDSKFILHGFTAES